MSSGSNGIFPYTTAIDSGGVDFDLETGTGTLNLGADAAAKVINVGNTTGVSSLALRNGTGDYFLIKLQVH